MEFLIGVLFMAAWLVGVTAYDRLVAGYTEAGAFAGAACLVLLVGALALCWRIGGDD